MYDNIYTDLDGIRSLIETLSDGKALPALAAFVDGRNLSCPMPLLKSKIALRDITHGTIYMVASDKNSWMDMRAFCQKNHLSLDSWQTQGETDDTLYHFLITKA